MYVEIVSDVGVKNFYDADCRNNEEGEWRIQTQTGAIDV